MVDGVWITAPAGLPNDFVVLRVRYLDDVLDRAFADGIDQIVLLGAGFDTTSLRHQRAGATFFEVDVPACQRTAETARGWTWEVPVGGQ